MKTKGFTLVELLVVIAILAILATVSVVGYTSFIDRAEQSNAQTEADSISKSIQSYNVAGMDYVLGTTGSGDSLVTYYINEDGKLCSIAATDDAEEAEASAIPTTGFTWNTDIATLLTEKGTGYSITVTGKDLVYNYETGKYIVLLEDVVD